MAYPEAYARDIAAADARAKAEAEARAKATAQERERAKAREDQQKQSTDRDRRSSSDAQSAGSNRDPFKRGTGSVAEEPTPAPSQSGSCNSTTGLEGLPMLGLLLIPAGMKLKRRRDRKNLN